MSDARSDLPKVSVCMVTYNQQRYIAQAIESVLAQQTTFPIEIVVGEDCSTDDTRSIVEDLARRHPDRIRAMLRCPNRGGKQNFMQTFAECRGEYVAILEGDDYWTCPQKLQMQVEALDARPDWAMCFHPAEIVYEDPNRAPGRWPEKWTRSEAALLDLFTEDFIPTNAVLFRNRLFGDFPPWFAEVLNGDWALHMLNAQHGNIGFLPDVMSVYRVHADGMWSSKDHGAQMAALMKTLSAVDHHFAGKYMRAIDECRINILQFSINEALQAKAACARFAEESNALQEWRAYRQSVTFKVIREVVRPWKQLWKHTQQRLQRSDGTKSPSGNDASKAA